MFIPEVCKFYLDGGCKFGELCKFVHQKTKSNPKICKFYKKGFCKNADKCQFLHERSDYPLKCYAVRHGQSQYNQKLQQFLGKNQNATSSVQQFQCDETLIDASLTDLGIQQCIKARANYLQNDVEVIFVSPLNRALETCDIIFKDRQIPIVVVPEFAQVLSMICDVSKPIAQKKIKYQHMDFDLFKDINLDWQTPQISVVHNVEFSSLEAQNITNALFSLMAKKLPQRLQTDSDCRARVLRGLAKIKKICAHRGIKKAAIVAHRRVIRELSRSDAQKAGVGLQNGEILQLDL